MGMYRLASVTLVLLASLAAAAPAGALAPARSFALTETASHRLAVTAGLASAQSGSGCPAAAGPTPVSGDHCVPLAVTPVWVDSPSAGGCGEALFLKMKLQKGIAVYGAEWRWASRWTGAPWVFHATGGPNGTGSGPYGEEQWSTVALTPQNTGVNVHYRVPKGYGAWFVAAGGGPGPCSNAATVQSGWGWTAQATIDGSVLDGRGGPVKDALIHIRGPVSIDTRSASDGSFGPYRVKPGSYIVSAYYDVDGRQFKLVASRCFGGSRNGRACQAHLGSHRHSSLHAVFAADAKVTVRLKPATVAGDGRGVSDVTIKVTLNGDPVPGHDLVVLLLADRWPPVLRSHFALSTFLSSLSGAQTQAVACGGNSNVPAGDTHGSASTDRAGIDSFKLFVGGNRSIVDPFQIGGWLSLTITDLLDPNPLPGLTQGSARLDLHPSAFAGIPTPDELRQLSTKHHPPALTSDEHADQLALLNWLLEAGVKAEFGPLDDTSNGEYFIYFGNYWGAALVGQSLGLPVLTVSEAKDIFGSVLLSSQLPTAAEQDLSGSWYVPAVDTDPGLFWGGGLLPDPATTAGRALIRCVVGPGGVDPSIP